MGNDGFVWMNDHDRRRAAPRRTEPRRTEPPMTPGEPLVARIAEEPWPVVEPTLADIGAQLQLWVRSKVRRVRREGPRWVLDRLAGRWTS